MTYVCRKCKTPLKLRARCPGCKSTSTVPDYDARIKALENTVKSLSISTKRLERVHLKPLSVNEKRVWELLQNGCTMQEIVDRTTLRRRSVQKILARLAYKK